MVSTRSVSTAYAFIQTVLQDIREQTQRQRFAIKTYHLLCIDDLGSEPVIPNVSIEWLFAIINERTLAGLATVCSTNLRSHSCKTRYDDRFMSRLCDKNTTLVLHLTGENLRTVNITPMLLLCATPIGNLGDLTPRVREALSSCDAVYCEDTRRTLTLLNHIGVKKPLVSCYRENERQRAEEVVRRLQAGETIVYVSDAGMPGISDPGEALISACIANNLPYSVLPGASAVLMAAVMSGLPAMPFTFFGFFPREKKEQKPLLEQLKRLDHLAIFYESPNRVHATLTALHAALGDLDAAVLRELTKLHEEAVRGTLSELAARYAETAPRGECVLCGLLPRRGAGGRHARSGSAAQIAACLRLVRTRRSRRSGTGLRGAEERSVRKSTRAPIFSF